MKFSRVGILLIVAIAFWATGAAHWAHEALEHSEGATAQLTPAVTTFGPHFQAGHSDSHSHEDCSVCQILSGITIEYIAPGISLLVHSPSLETLHLVQSSPPVIFVAWLLPSRGPPANPFPAV